MISLKNLGEEVEASDTVKVESMSMKLHFNWSHLSLLVLNLAYGISRLPYVEFQGLDFSDSLTSNTVASEVLV